MQFPIPLKFPMKDSVSVWLAPKYRKKNCAAFAIRPINHILSRYALAGEFALIPPLTPIPSDAHEALRKGDNEAARSVRDDWAREGVVLPSSIMRYIGREQLKSIYSMNRFFALALSSRRDVHQTIEHFRRGGLVPYYFPASSHPISPILSLTYVSLFRWVRNADSLNEEAAQYAKYKNTLAMGLPGEEVLVVSSPNLVETASVFFWQVLSLQKREINCVGRFLSAKAKNEPTRLGDYAALVQTSEQSSKAIWLPYAPAEVYILKMSYARFIAQIAMSPISGRRTLRFQTAFSVKRGKKGDIVFRAVRQARILASLLELWPRPVPGDISKGIGIHYGVVGYGIYRLIGQFGEATQYIIRIQMRNTQKEQLDEIIIKISPDIWEVLHKESGQSRPIYLFANMIRGGASLKQSFHNGDDNDNRISNWESKYHEIFARGSLTRFALHNLDIKREQVIGRIAIMPHGEWIANMEEVLIKGYFYKKNKISRKKTGNGIVVRRQWHYILPAIVAQSAEIASLLD